MARSYQYLVWYSDQCKHLEDLDAWLYFLTNAADLLVCVGLIHDEIENPNTI